jgi:hypothetical protein
MGSVYENLEGHEGFAMRRLPDGTTTSSWAVEAVFSSYVAACECDWRGGDYAPTEEGYEEAIDEWDRRHAQPLVAQGVPRSVGRMIREMKQILNDLVDERPAVGVKALRDVPQWASAIEARASDVERVPAPRLSHRQPDRRRLSL